MPRAAVAERVRGRKGLFLVAGPVLAVYAVRRIAEAAHAGPERFVVAARAPRPAGTLGNGQMIVAE